MSACENDIKERVEALEKTVEMVNNRIKIFIGDEKDTVTIDREEFEKLDGLASQKILDLATEKPPEPDCKACKYFIVHVENCEKECAYYADGQKLIAEFKTDFDYVWFIMENEGIFDSVTPGDYKKLHAIKKKWEARSK